MDMDEVIEKIQWARDWLLGDGEAGERLIQLSSEVEGSDLLANDPLFLKVLATVLEEASIEQRTIGLCIVANIVLNSKNCGVLIPSLQLPDILLPLYCSGQLPLMTECSRVFGNLIFCGHVDKFVEFIPTILDSIDFVVLNSLDPDLLCLTFRLSFYIISCKADLSPWCPETLLRVDGERLETLELAKSVVADHLNGFEWLLALLVKVTNQHENLLPYHVFDMGNIVRSLLVFAEAALSINEQFYWSQITFNVLTGTDSEVQHARSPTQRSNKKNGGRPPTNNRIVPFNFAKDLSMEEWAKMFVLIFEISNSALMVRNLDEFETSLLAATLLLNTAQSASVSHICEAISSIEFRLLLESLLETDVQVWLTAELAAEKVIDHDGATFLEVFIVDVIGCLQTTSVSRRGQGQGTVATGGSGPPDAHTQLDALMRMRATMTKVDAPTTSTN